MATPLTDLRRTHGDVVERATLARDLLVPLASRLSGDPSDLHRRCVLGQRLVLYLRRFDPVLNDPAVEATACWFSAATVLLVFRTAESAAAAIRRHTQKMEEMGSVAQYSAVPPPEFALPQCFIEPQRIKVAVYPPPAATEDPARRGSNTGAEETTNEGAPETAPDTRWTPRPVILYLDSSGVPMPVLRPAPGVTDFVLSSRSNILGPKLGEDGHLWVEGNNITLYENGVYMEKLSHKRVIRVAPPTPDTTLVPTEWYSFV